MSQWLTTLSVYASGQLGITKRQLGALFGINGLMVVALQLPVTRGLRRLSLVGSLTLGAAVYAVSFLGLAFARTWLHLVAGMVAITLAELIFSPPSVALVSLIAPPERTGRYMGIYSLVTAFGWSAGPFVGGLLLDRWVEEPLRLWGSVAALGAAGAVGFAATRRRYRTRMPS